MATERHRMKKLKSSPSATRKITTISGYVIRCKSAASVLQYLRLFIRLLGPIFLGLYLNANKSVNRGQIFKQLFLTLFLDKNIDH